jgi:hypothetical protein
MYAEDTQAMQQYEQNPQSQCFSDKILEIYSLSFLFSPPDHQLEKKVEFYLQWGLRGCKRDYFFKRLSIKRETPAPSPAASPGQLSPLLPEERELNYPRIKFTAPQMQWHTGTRTLHWHMSTGTLLWHMSTTLL